MRVKYLIKALEKLDQEAVVLMSSDQEGNSHSLFDGLLKDVFYRKQDYEIEIFDQEDINEDPTLSKNAKKCIVLYP
jgi:hypothetical protein